MIVLLAVDIVTGMTQFLPEPLAFPRGELPVRPIKSLIDANSGLLSLQSSRFISSQFSTSDSLMNSSLLALLTPVDPVVAIGQSRCCTHSCSKYQTQCLSFH